MRTDTPRRFRRRLQPVGTALARSARRAYGMHPRSCTVCGYEGRFHAYGAPLRFDAMCPRCGSLERHRLLAMWVREHHALLAEASVLHFAPEQCLEALLRPLCRSYTSTDMNIDVEHLERPDASFDVVICSHVLERVDDRRAPSELHRIIRPGGIVLLLVPILDGWAYGAGFELGELVAVEPAVSRHALSRGETVFIARRG